MYRRREAMVNISPLDIRKHEFKKVLRGYDPDEVLAFLDMVSVEMEGLIRESSTLREKAASFETQLKKYHDIENTLRETLLSAQKAREETINMAKKHADVIIREAEVKAASIVDEGRNELARVRGSFSELKMQKDSFLVKIRSMVNAQLDLLNNIEFPEEAAAEALTGTARPNTVAAPPPAPAPAPEPPRDVPDNPLENGLHS